MATETTLTKRRTKTGTGVFNVSAFDVEDGVWHTHKKCKTLRAAIEACHDLAQKVGDDDAMILIGKTWGLTPHLLRTPQKWCGHPEMRDKCPDCGFKAKS